MEALDIYSQIIVKHGVGLWPGQGLFIRGRCTHKDLALRIGEAGYNEGAGEVRYHLTDQEEIAQLIRCGSPKHISSHLERDRAFYEDVLLREGAFVLLLDDCPLDPTIEKAYRMRPDNRRQFIHGRNRTCTEFQNRAMDKRPLENQERPDVLY